MEQFEHLEETQLSSEAKYDGTLLHIRRDTVRLPNGQTATREYNIHNGAVCIIPLLENGEVLLERQYRYPLREVITEIPAGKLDAPGRRSAGGGTARAARGDRRDGGGMACAGAVLPGGRVFDGANPDVSGARADVRRAGAG